MEIVKHWDYLTLLFYIFIAILIAYLFKVSIKVKNNKKKMFIFRYEIEKKYLYYFIIYIIFILFTCFRYISPGIGGTDTLVYMELFNNISYTHLNIKDMLLLDGNEYLFYNLMYIVRLFGGNYYIFQFIVYSIIVICYIYFIDKFINDEKQWICIMLFMIPILKSLNIIRNCLAVAISLISIDYLRNEKYLKCFLVLLISFLCHYISIVLIVFAILYYVICSKYNIINKYLEQRKKVLLSIFCSIFLSILVLPIVKFILENFGYSAYLDNIEISLLGYIPVVLCLIFSLLYLKDFIKFLKKKNHYILYKLHIFYILILPLSILIGGASRIGLFFEIPRYILWSDLYIFYRKKIDSKYLLLYDIISIMIIILWIIFRIFRIWEGYSLMPYYNIIFM